jgi:LuxR family maltose regulon positive regulatory protein
VLGLIPLARGELDAADKMLPAVGEEFLLQPGGYWTVAIADARARLLALRGHPEAALRVLDAALESSRWTPTRGHEAELRAARADLLTESGHPRKALQLLARPGGDGAPQLPVETVAFARALVATGRARAAANSVRALSLDDSDRSLRLRVRARLVAALAAQALGESGDAASSLAQAVALAAAHQLAAPFMTPDVARLLHAYPRILTPYPELSRVLAPAVAPAPTGQDPTSPAAARLTDRERAVLAYLPTLMTVDEIGETLHISTNTVKTHVRHIYRKLGISSRRDAMRRAWELGLL